MTLSYSTLKRRRLSRLGKRRGINSTLPVAGKTMKRSKGALRKVARKKVWRRKPSEFARIYGSRERVRFVKSLPCVACGVVGFSENAHVCGSGGMSRKGPFTEIAPMCGTHWEGLTFVIGCHFNWDNARRAFLHRHPGFQPERAAIATEQAWQSHLKEGSA